MELTKSKVRLIQSVLLVLFFMVLISSEGTVNAQSEEEYKGVAYCAECHPAETAEWGKSVHTKAYSNDDFQDVWQDLDSSPECLECHTTGFDKKTNTYESKEVTCESCHGPGDTMNRDTSPELCGECHSGPYPTYEEMTQDGSTHSTVECLTCHDMHTSQMTFETTTETCGQCHESHIEEVAETAHGYNNVECIDCHMVVEDADFVNGVQAKTGHSFNPIDVELDCTSCHEIELDKHDILGKKAGACISCHGDIHELKLQLVNGDTHDQDDPVPLCAQCHNERYTAWEEGTHGAHDDPQAVCTRCHNPHEPIINQITTLDPIPSRELANPPSVLLKIFVVVVIEILGFSVLILRSRENV